MSDQRHFNRVLFHTPVLVKIGEYHPFAGSIDDISLKGALVNVPPGTRPAIDTPCLLEVVLNAAEGAHIIMNGRIAHVEDGSMGVRCVSMDLESASHLRRVVELNLGSDKLLQRELAALIRHT